MAGFSKATEREGVGAASVAAVMFTLACHGISWTSRQLNLNLQPETQFSLSSPCQDLLVVTKYVSNWHSLYGQDPPAAELLRLHCGSQ